MQKIKKPLILFLTILAVHFTMFLCHIPKFMKIFNTSFLTRFGYKTLIINILVYFLYILLFSAVINLSLRKKKMLDLKYWLKLSLISLVPKLFLDIIHNILSKKIINYIGFLDLAFYVLMLFFIIICDMFFIRKISINSFINKKTKILIPVFVTIVAVSLYTFLCCNKISLVYEKYDVETLEESITSFFAVLGYFNNFKFIYSFINVFICAAIFTINIYVYLSIAKEENQAEYMPDTLKKRAKILFSTLICCPIIYILCFLLIPLNVISGMSKETEQDDIHHMKYKSFMVYITKGGQKYSIYDSQTDYIAFSGNEYKVKYNYLNENAIDLLRIDDDCYVYQTNKIFIRFNGEVKIISFKDIHKESENVVLTKVLKYLLENGYANTFVYSVDYLIKYDNDFIKPYIERYQNGNFNEDEKQNTYVKPEYIKKIADKY